MVYRLAVDLGTAFAAAAVVNGSDPAMVGLGNRTMQVPSVLFLSDDSSYVVGESAERRGLTEPDRVVREFKRRFGDPVPLVVAGAAYSAESLMARLLRWVVSQTSMRQGEPPAELMLAHPANWGPYKRELLDQVVALADLEGARYCTEPEAAAVHYAARAKVSVGQRLAVYDLGGGTFDACVLEKLDHGFAVIGTPDGIEHLGGADIDEAMSQLVLRALGAKLEDLDVDDLATMIGLARLRRDCVEAKEALSTDTDVAIPVNLPGVSTVVRINRSELEATMRPALLDSVATFRRTLASAQTAPEDLSVIVMVGGSSQIPLVGELLQREFGVPLSIDTHPKHDIALGAALLCRESAEAPAVGGSTIAALSTPQPPVNEQDVDEVAVDGVAEAPTPPPPAPPQAPTSSLSTPSTPEKPRRRKTPLVAAGAVIAGIAVIVAIVLANSGGGDNTSTTISSGTAPVVEVSGKPSVDELMRHIPDDYRSTCQESTDGIEGAAVTISCAPAEEIQSATHAQFATADAFEKAVNELFGHEPDSDCTSAHGEGPYQTESPDGRPRSGRLLCHDSDGSITFTSTTDQLRVISVITTQPTSGWGYPELKGAWDDHPLW